MTVEYPRTKINESGIFTTEIQHVRVNAVMENGTRTTVYEYDSVSKSTSCNLFGFRIVKIFGYWNNQRCFSKSIPK